MKKIFKLILIFAILCYSVKCDKEECQNEKADCCSLEGENICRSGNSTQNWNGNLDKSSMSMAPHSHGKNYCSVNQTSCDQSDEQFRNYVELHNEDVEEEGKEKKKSIPKKIEEKLLHFVHEFDKVDLLDPIDIAWRGNLKRSIKDAAGAVKDFGKALKLKANDYFIKGRLGDLKRMQGDFVGALKELNEAHKLNPKDWWVLVARSQVHMAMGKIKRALEDIEKANIISPSNLRVLAVRGALRISSGDVDKGLADIEKAKSMKPNSIEALLQAAEEDLKNKNYRSALENLNLAAELQQSIDLSNEDKFEIGTAVFDDEDESGEFELSNEDLIAMINRASIKMRHWEFRSAIEDLDAVLRASPNDFLAHVLRSFSKFVTGHWKGSFQDMLQAFRNLSKSAFKQLISLFSTFQVVTSVVLLGFLLYTSFKTGQVLFQIVKKATKKTGEQKAKKERRLEKQFQRLQSLFQTPKHAAKEVKPVDKAHAEHDETLQKEFFIVKQPSENTVD